MTGQILDPSAAKNFVYAGHAIFTLVSKRTANRFTFEVQKAEDRDIWFVRVLTQPDNANGFEYLGTATPLFYCHGKKSRISPEAPAALAATWFFSHLSKGDALDQVEFWHEGKCGRCGRRLTVPESIATGMGPVCAGYGG